MTQNCGHGKSLREECLACQKMDEADQHLRQRVKDLEEENARLRVAFRNIDAKYSALLRRNNRAQEDAYNDVTPDRDDR